MGNQEQSVGRAKNPARQMRALDFRAIRERPELVCDWVESLDSAQLRVACRWAYTDLYRRPGPGHSAFGGDLCISDKRRQAIGHRLSIGNNAVCADALAGAGFHAEEAERDGDWADLEAVLVTAIILALSSPPHVSRKLRGQAVDQLRDVVFAVDFYERYGEDLFAYLLDVASHSETSLPLLRRPVLAAAAGA